MAIGPPIMRVHREYPSATEIVSAVPPHITIILSCNRRKIRAYIIAETAPKNSDKVDMTVALSFSLRPSAAAKAPPPPTPKRFATMDRDRYGA